MYEAIVTYTFKTNEGRDSFVEFLLGLGLTNHPDQSTFALHRDVILSVGDLKNAIFEWGRSYENRTHLQESTVQVYAAGYYQGPDQMQYPTIRLKEYKYDILQGRFRERLFE